MSRARHEGGGRLWGGHGEVKKGGEARLVPTRVGRAMASLGAVRLRFSPLAAPAAICRRPVCATVGNRMLCQSVQGDRGRQSARGGAQGSRQSRFWHTDATARKLGRCCGRDLHSPEDHPRKLLSAPLAAEVRQARRKAQTRAQRRRAVCKAWRYALRGAPSCRRLRRPRHRCNPRAHRRAPRRPRTRRARHRIHRLRRHRIGLMHTSGATSSALQSDSYAKCACQSTSSRDRSEDSERA